MTLEKTSNQVEEYLKIPSREFDRVSEKGRQLIELLANGEQINSRVLWTALGLANEREPFIALWRIRDEINNKLSAYGEVYEVLAVHGRPFAWRQAESVSLGHKMDAAIRELREVVKLAGQSNDSEKILREVAGEIEILTTAIQTRLREIGNI